MATALILPLFGSLKSLLTGEPQGAGFVKQKPESHSNVGQRRGRIHEEGAPRRPLPPPAVSGSFWAGILAPAPELVVSASKPVATPLLSLPFPRSSHTERNALSSPLCASRYAVLSVKGASLV